MYEYCPKPKRTRERVMASLLLILAAISYSCSSVLPYPIVYQLLAVISLTWMIVIVAGYLLRDYGTRLSEDGEREAVLTVTETRGKRQTVVARFRACEIRRVEPYSKEVVRAERRLGHTVYRYVCELHPQNAYFAEAESNGTRFWMTFYADETLIAMLEHYKKQYLSEI